MAFTWVDANVAAGELTEPQKSSGCKEIVRCITFETAAADAAGDVKALFRVGAHEIPIEGWLISDAIAGATDIDIGFYRDDQTVVDKDALADGINPSAGIAWASRLDILSALAVDERGVRKMYEIAGDVATTDVIGHIPADSYVLALTEVSEVTAAGTITIMLRTIAP
jgi:hypothetical protein